MWISLLFFLFVVDVVVATVAVVVWCLNIFFSNGLSGERSNVAQGVFRQLFSKRPNIIFPLSDQCFKNICHNSPIREVAGSGKRRENAKLEGYLVLHHHCQIIISIALSITKHHQQHLIWSYFFLFRQRNGHFVEIRLWSLSFQTCAQPWGLPRTINGWNIISDANHHCTLPPPPPHFSPSYLDIFVPIVTIFNSGMDFCDDSGICSVRQDSSK